MKDNMIAENKKRWNLKDWLLPFIITIIGIFGSIHIGGKQVESAEKIAQSEQQIKMWELLSRESFDPRIEQDTVWTYDPLIILLGSILRDSSNAETPIYKSARAIFEESINAAIQHFYRKEKFRTRASRYIGALYHIDKQYVVNRLIEELKPKDYIWSHSVNGAVLVALVKMPGYWEGTKQQYEKINELRSHKYLGWLDSSKTEYYRHNFLEVALKNWKQVRE